MDMKQIGIKIKQRRESLNISAEELAQEIGVHKATIHRYENADFKSMKLPVIEAIAHVLKVNPAWLLGTSDDMEEPTTTPLTPRDQKDISLIIDQTKQLLAQDGLMFDGVPADDESIQSIIDAMTIGLELAKKKNKEKYTPKKYKKD
jgi:transcriptional regulator with XRE-family HTH domain